jgi:hypothetical protein
MTTKSSRDKARVELAELRTAMEQARYATGEGRVTVCNDPEDPALLETYRLGLNDTSTIEIGPGGYPGPKWYAQYAAAAKSGDSERARDLLFRGAAAVREEEEDSPLEGSL